MVGVGFDLEEGELVFSFFIYLLSGLYILLFDIVVIVIVAGSVIKSLFLVRKKIVFGLGLCCLCW